MFLDANPLWITIGMFTTMLVLLMLGTPLAFSLLSVGIVFYYLFGGVEFEQVFSLLATSTFDSMNNFLLVAVPMFIFMGLMLQKSGITDSLFDMISKIMGGFPGGLGIGTIIICALIAAMAGVSGAATVSLGIIALPSMLKLGYDKKLSTGAIMAGGALGFLIPPSVLMILYAYLAKVSVGKLFAAGMVPGLMLAGIYMLYIFARAVINPSVAPSIPKAERQNVVEKVKSLKYLILPGSLVTLVLWCIISGKTTPSEAAAIGAAGSILCAAIYKTLTFPVLKEVVFDTAKLMGMIIWITLAATFFSKVYMLLDGAVMIEELIEDSGLSPTWIVVMMLMCYFVLGMFLDDFAIVFITVPIFMPIIDLLGIDPIWFAVLFVVSMQTAYLTPPFGYNLFYMRSVAPPEITINDLYKAVVPFIILQIIALTLMVIFPDIVMWLPNKINFG